MPRWLAWWTGAAAVWLAVVVVIFWYPFDFRFEPGFVRERLLSLWRAPFTTYYFGTEYRAATEILHKVVFFLPGGALLAFLSLRVERPIRRRVIAAGGLAFIGLVALTVEAGQAFLPSKVADLTDAGLETMGGILGYLTTGAIARSPGETRRGGEDDERAVSSPFLRFRFVLTLPGWAVTRLPSSRKRRAPRGPSRPGFGLPRLLLDLRVPGLVCPACRDRRRGPWVFPACASPWSGAVDPPSAVRSMEASTIVAGSLWSWGIPGVEMIALRWRCQHASLRSRARLSWPLPFRREAESRLYH
jgi:hypothetical protein